MGFIDRLKGGRKASTEPQYPDARPQIELPSVDTVSRMVVGTEHYQRAFARHDDGPAEFELRTEPDNPYDANAIAVYLDSRHIGYLAAGAAKAYQAVVARLEQEGRFVVAGLVEPWQSVRGARVELPKEAALESWSTEPAGTRPSALRHSHFWLKRSGDYQEQLTRFLGNEPVRTVPVLVEAKETPSGKYKGQPCLHFSVDGEEIGLLQAGYRDQAPGLHDEVSTTGPTTLEATIRAADDGKLITGVEFFHP